MDKVDEFSPLLKESKEEQKQALTIHISMTHGGGLN